MRLIDADAMIERLKEWDTNDSMDKILHNFTLNRIQEMPTFEPEPCKLALDGEALMEAFYNTPKKRQNWNHAWHLFNHAKLAQPERKKGEWILVNGKTSINCSYCYHCSWSLLFEDTVRQFNFCPNCGADMRGDENETD